jgi:hypothetical protein
MIPKPLNQVNVDDLTALVGNVRESKTIEFKREMPARTQEEKVKFLSAVSSLANTSGGDLIIGMEAVDGLAQSISGVEISNLDGEKLRLEQLLAFCIEPRLPRCDIVAVDRDNNRHVIIVRVARSWIGPHRVTLNDKFYGRNSAGKYPLDVSELRTAFVLSEAAVERIRAFRAGRLVKIIADEAPVLLHPGGRIVIHTVPVATFAVGRTLDVTQQIRTSDVPLPPGRISHSYDYHPNLDGLVFFCSPRGEAAGGYAQVFRTGAVEGVDVLHIDPETKGPYLIGLTFETEIVGAVRNYVKFILSLELGYPIVIFISLCGVQGCRIRVPAEFGTGRGSLPDDVIPLPEISLESETQDVASALRPVFNQIWNAFGFMASSSFDKDGKWISRTI